ncbi:unnamed protein product [Jaminaea pallidilutea]
MTSYPAAAASTSRLSSSAAPSTSSSHLPSLPDSLHIAQLNVRLPLGVDSWERLSPQPVTIDIQVHTDVSQAGQSDHLPYSIHYGILVKEVEKHCAQVAAAVAAAQGSGGATFSSTSGKHAPRYRSLEGLADGIAKVCIFTCKAPMVTLKVQKPRALLHAKSAGVEIVRTAQDFVRPDGSRVKLSDEISGSDQYSLLISPNSPSAVHDKVVVRDLLVSTILGVNPWERVDKQVVKINLVIYTGLERRATRDTVSQGTDVVTSPQNYRTIVRAVSEHVERTDYKTVESLALSIAQVAVERNRVHRIRVRVDKPSAIMFADSAGCEIERSREFFVGQQEGVAGLAAIAAKEAAQPPASHLSESSPSADPQWHVVAIALGSNLGDRGGNIERAVRALETHPECRLIDTSFLYETTPMYYADQPKFLNGACRIATKLSPEALLDLTQSIETQVGRDKSGVPIKGPRVIDLDIIFYDRVEVATERLTLPHAGLLEREFVLRPMADILPDYAHPTTRRTVKQLLNILVNSAEYEEESKSTHVRRVMPVSDTSTWWSWGDKTLIMGIINATPDSFSDGGDNFAVRSALDSAKDMLSKGADVLDIGGMSTAPKAAEVSAEEECARVVPVIRAIRQCTETQHVPISIDTFRASVARAALNAGANIINDVTGGQRDPTILEVSHERNAPIVLMHMRGDSSTMASLAKYDDDSGGVVGAVKRELEERVQAALATGVRRWNIILDPGIGFAKDREGNLELLRGIASLTEGDVSTGNVYGTRSGAATPNGLTSAASESLKRASNGELVGSRVEASRQQLHSPHSSLRSFPMLLGTSRKRFIGSILSEGSSAAGGPAPAPKDRVWGTAATCAAAIVTGKVDVLRVHDVKEMKDVAQVTDAIIRPRPVERGAP